MRNVNIYVGKINYRDNENNCHKNHQDKFFLQNMK